MHLRINYQGIDISCLMLIKICKTLVLTLAYIILSVSHKKVTETEYLVDFTDTL